MVLQDENTLNVSNGWSIFYREGSTPITDPALLLGAEPVGEEGEAFLYENLEITAKTSDGDRITEAVVHILDEDGLARLAAEGEEVRS